MSGFDDNPFVEPTIDNPFAIGYKQGNSEPAIMQPIQDPPMYTRSAQQTQPHAVLNTAELQRKQEELERKEEELARREEEMRQSSYNVRRNNWPPLPEQCCFQPCFYQDINVDIPLEFQKIVRHLYYLWMFHGMVMILNVIGGIVLMRFTVIGLGILFTLLFTPFSYLCWFRPAYKAFKSDSSFNFMVFFFVFFFQFVITTVQAIGIPGSGTIGLIIALNVFDGTVLGILSGIFSLLIALGFACAAAADIFLISKIHRMYRSTGASFAKAQAEFTTEFLRNSHVREAASDVAAAAVQSRFQTPENRY
ncbi:PREDICTED: secretory carrier-associated membrane protein 1 isoform X2 [Nicrophorus vespilloides]|uniref:Secretory carrier-associated membrane protein n=1 Tax=Nicrophorus vespilloides TaxID=110193 RepID=A0ABM1N7Q0_NICVS|nr:PREDICTED: secretory carrier-associated membrane protein 1 isoform X2 [Nicrophorus vespilloides]